jgi:class 3 adenylate cyclase/predicted ATPase
MFCDLVGSTDLASTLDPEDLREVVRAYQETAAAIIQRYEGHIAQYLGDGLLVYFGFPVAHEDDASRAVHTGLSIVNDMATLNIRLSADYGVQLAVRIGIHIGPVVVGEMGGGGRHENLALGETPNIAARLQGLAQPNTIVVTPVTAQLVQRSFVLEELGFHGLKGVAEPVRLLRVIGPREEEQDHETMTAGGFAALVGRNEEIGLLLRRWEQSKEGHGQVIVMSGEAGIGKSRLVDGLRHHVRQEGMRRITFRCSPYHTNSALYPIIEHLRRVLNIQPDDTAETQLMKLEQGLGGTRLCLEDAVPLLAALLSFPLTTGRYESLTLSPQQQRQQTQDTLVAWLLEEAERHPILAVWEDLHWADPSTLEVLSLFVDQTPTAAMLHVLTFRPVFRPPWPMRSHMTSLTLNHLERSQVKTVITRLAGGKTIPAEVVEHIITKTDGVPLFVEELTKMLLASALLREEAHQYVLTGPLLTMAIPDTLQASLMARLDQFNTAKELAQLGAVIGRAFPYTMIQSLSALEEGKLQEGLGQLVTAELLYQRGRPPHATYIFKHALIQDAAYASLLRTTRQRYHHQIAELMVAAFSETVETQPELVAYHYTEGGHAAQAVRYWQQAGQRAIERSAYLEAFNHLSRGVDLLLELPDTPERAAQELMLRLALGQVFMLTKGQGAPEVEQTYARARALCQEVASTQQLFPALAGLCGFYVMRGALQTARELGEQLLSLAEQDQDPALLLQAHQALGGVFLHLGELPTAHAHWRHALALSNAPPDRSQATPGSDTRVVCLSHMAWCLWFLGYPAQALQRADEALARAQTLAHPFTLVFARNFAAWLQQCCRQERGTQERAEVVLELTTDLGAPDFVAAAMIIRGWALALQGQSEESQTQMRQGLVAYQATGAELHLTSLLALIAEGYLHLGQAEKGCAALEEAFVLVDKNSECYYEAELYRLKGESVMRMAVDGYVQAEGYFQQALDVARRQQTKSWELRAAMSLSRLWQQQGKRTEAYQLLSDIYGWFTEGFDTGDLQAAKALLVELA